MVTSGVVGPEAITDGSSPGTSEIIRETILAGAAATASRPPLMADKCLRTQLISLMLAPLLSSALFKDRLSSSVRGGAGAERRADPPPYIRQSARSFGPRRSDEIEDPASRHLAGGVRDRMGGLDHLDPFQGARRRARIA